MKFYYFIEVYKPLNDRQRCFCYGYGATCTCTCTLCTAIVLIRTVLCINDCQTIAPVEPTKPFAGCGGHLGGLRKSLAWSPLLFSRAPSPPRVICGGPRHVLVAPRGLPSGAWNYLWLVLYVDKSLSIKTPLHI